MDIIEVKALTQNHLKDYWALYAIDEFQNTQHVWSSKKLAPFCNGKTEGTVMNVLYIRVENLDGDGVKPLIEALMALDPLGTISGNR